MSWRLHHIGYLTDNLQAEAARWCADLGYVRDGPVQLDTSGTAWVCFLHQPGADHWLELVAPNNTSPKVSKTLRQTQSYHHICYEVPDVAAALAKLRANGWLPLGNPVPEAIFGGRPVVWLMNNRRALIELVQAGEGPYQQKQLCATAAPT